MIRVLLVDDQELVRSGFRIILDSEPGIEVVGEAADGEEGVRLAAGLRPDVICMDVEMPTMNGIEASRRILAAPASGSPPEHRPAILILTTFGHDAYLFDALSAGVRGFLLKTSRAEQLIEAVRALAAGQALLGPDVTQAVIARIATLPGDDRDTPREDDPAEDHAGAGGAEGPTRTDGGDDGDDGLDGARRSDGGGRLPEDGTSPSAAVAMDAAGLTQREREVLPLVAAGLSNGEIAARLYLGEATVKTHVSNLLQKLAARDRIQLVVWAHAHGVV